MTVTSCAGKHMTSRSFFTLVLPSRWLIFRNCFHAVNIAIKQQQYCNTVRPQLNSDRFTQHMTSQTWRIKRLFLNYSFTFNTRYEHFYNLKRLYSSYLSGVLWYKRICFNSNYPFPLFYFTFRSGIRVSQRSEVNAKLGDGVLFCYAFIRFPFRFWITGVKWSKPHRQKDSETRVLQPYLLLLSALCTNAAFLVRVRCLY